MSNRSVSCGLPPAYVARLDELAAQRDVARGDVLRQLIADGLGLPRLDTLRRASSRAQRDERAKGYMKLYDELGTYAAVGRAVGFSTGTVRRQIFSYESRLRRDQLRR